MEDGKEPTYERSSSVAESTFGFSVGPSLFSLNTVVPAAAIPSSCGLVRFSRVDPLT